MRRMLKEAADAHGGDGGLLSELHALPGSGFRNSALVSRTTWPLSTVVNCETGSLETYSRSALTQFDQHHCERSAGLIASTPRWFTFEWL